MWPPEMSLDYEALPRDYPRRYLPVTVALTDWNQIGKYFDELRLREPGSVQDLKGWLDDYSEVFVAMSEAASIRYVRMTEQTDRDDYRAAYLAFVENIESKVKVAQFYLNRKFVESQFRKSLPPGDYSVLER